MMPVKNKCTSGTKKAEAAAGPQQGLLSPLACQTPSEGPNEPPSTHKYVVDLHFFGRPDKEILFFCKIFGGYKISCSCSKGTSQAQQ